MFDRIRQRVSTFAACRFPVKLTAAYALIAMLMVVASSLLTVHYAEDFLQTEIQRADQHLLSQVRVFYDHSLVREVLGIVNREFLNRYTAGHIAAFFSERDDPPEYYFHLTNVLTNIALNSEYVDSIYLYRVRDDVLAASEAGVTFGVSGRHGLSPAPLNIALIAQARIRSESWFWLTPAQNHGFGASGPQLTFVRRIPLYGGSESPDGWVFVNIDAALVMSRVISLYVTQPAELAVVDSAGRVISHSDPSLLYEPLSGDLASLLGPPGGFATATVRGQESVVSWTMSEMTDWYFVSRTPVSELSARLLRLRRLSTAVVAAALVLTVLLVVALSTRLFRPLRRVVEQLRVRFSAESIAVGDMEHIGDAVRRLLDQVEQMDETLEQNRRLIEHKTIGDIVFGNAVSAESVVRRITYLGLPVEPPRLGLMLVAFDNRVFKHLRFDPREYVVLQAGSIIQRFFENDARCASHEPAKMVALIGAAAYRKTPRVSSLMEQLTESLGMQCIITYCDQPVVPAEIAATFERLRPFDRYALLHGYGRVISGSALETMEARGLEVPPQEFTRLETLLRARNTHGFVDAAREIANRVRDTRCSFDSARAVLRQLQGTVLRVAGEVDLELESLSEPAASRDPLSAGSLDAALDRICDAARQLADFRARRVDAATTEFAERIAAHIRASVCRDTSLSSVAEAFGVSPGHLSRVFRSALGVHFSDVVHEAKLTRACDVLTESPMMAVSEIARDLGYDSASYFSRVFRKRYGVTPAVYRKQHMGVNT